MIPLGATVARLLTEQFYRWELRGRGWFSWPDWVELEPPFRAFDGHYIPAGASVDDGRIESTGSRLAGRILGFLGAGEPTEPEKDDGVDEPDADPSRMGRGLVELQVALPADATAKAEVFGQFIFSIGYAKSRIAFEVIGRQGDIVIQVTASEVDATLVRSQLKAFYPDAELIEASDFLKEALAQELRVSRVLDFGLEREFMVPIENSKGGLDPLIAICGMLDSLHQGEVGGIQILFEPVRNAWATSMVRAVTAHDGRSFFVNDPRLPDQAREKTGQPLFSVAVRMVASSPDDDRPDEILRGMAGAFHPSTLTGGNRLVPLENEIDDSDLVLDVVLRETHRSGMILNADELIFLAHLPDARVRARNIRRVSLRSRKVPRTLSAGTDGIRIGDNVHEGVREGVFLPLAVRLNHTHILGGTGSGKSTLLAAMAVADMEKGHGVALIDPHGDLIDLLLPHVPDFRREDVILFDPSDEEYAIGFNPLSAGSHREKELLAGDFIAVMKQHTSGWGDQMSSLLGNAVLAFLHNERVGTLPELRRFLTHPGFRVSVLTTVTSPEVAYYWQHEAGLTNKTAVGSILVRIDELLRSESLLHILGQRKNALDFADIMDSRKIFFARLSKGLVGQANAYLLGGLLVSKFYQTAIARQSRTREDRKPYMLLMDEAGELLTSTVSEILVGARKYGLGLTLAHQSLRQLAGNPEVYGAVTGSCGTKICFQVGGDDARKMADEFGGFQATDLMNLPKLQAIARVGPRDASFNLETQFLPDPGQTLEEAHRDIAGRSRSRYATPKAEVRKELEALADFLPKKAIRDPFAELAAKRQKERDEAQEKDDVAVAEGAGHPARNAAAETPKARDAQPLAHQAVEQKEPSLKLRSRIPDAEEPTPKSRISSADNLDPPESTELRSVKAEAIKNSIIQTAGGWGFSYETEYPILSGRGRIDLVLTLGNERLACEISATTTVEQEVEHLLNCLSAGFTDISCVCDATVRRNRIDQVLLSKLVRGQEQFFRFLTVRQFQARIAEIGQRSKKSKGGSPGKSASEPVIITKDDQQEIAQKQLAEIATRRAFLSRIKNK